MPRSSLSAAAALLTLALAGPVSAQRLLMEAPGLAAMLDQGFRCGQPARVTVEAGQPDVFQGESAELQRLIDAVHAMLAFECPDLKEIQVNGVLKGLRDPVYRAIAMREANWSLQAQQTVQSNAARPGVYAGPGRPTGPPAGESGGYTVAGLSLGMGVEDARAAISNAFGVTPDYDARQGILTMQAPACPQGQQWGNAQRPPQPGWKCLRAWFTDQREPRLYLLELVQVVPNQGVDAVERVLTERYGLPTQRGSGAPPGRTSGAAGNALHIAWGEALAPAAPRAQGAPRPTHSLVAVVEPLSDAIITTVTLYGPSLASGGAAPPAGGIDLKL